MSEEEFEIGQRVEVVSPAEDNPWLGRVGKVKRTYPGHWVAVDFENAAGRALEITGGRRAAVRDRGRSSMRFG